jgi:hypothetical protein
VLITKPNLQQSWPQLRPAMTLDAPTTFYVGFSVGGIEEKFQYELSINNVGPSQAPDEERLCLGDKCLFYQSKAGKAKTEWVVAPELFQVPVPGPIALGRIPSISDVVIAFTALTSGIGCYVFSDKVLCQPAQENRRTGGAC